MKFEVGDKVQMYNWRTARRIMRVLGKDEKDFVYGISKERWNKWRDAGDLTIEKAWATPQIEIYTIRSTSLDTNKETRALWVIPAVCLYKK